MQSIQYGLLMLFFAVSPLLFFLWICLIGCFF